MVEGITSVLLEADPFKGLRVTLEMAVVEVDVYADDVEIVKRHGVSVDSASVADAVWREKIASSKTAEQIILEAI